MLRASRALLRDEREIDLKPWLFRLTRNCALDELSRVKTDSVALDDEDSHIFLAAPASSEPERAHERRAGVRELLEDIATLPEVQRHALLRRELDGQSHEEIARELGLSEGSTKSLVFRARANLLREREARTEDCAEVRMQLIEAADAHRRAKPQTLRHVAKCPACREFRRELKASNRAIAILDPGVLLIGLGAGGGALKWLTGKGAAVKATAAATAGVAVVGVAVIGTQVFGPGDPSPVVGQEPGRPVRAARGAAADPGGHVDRPPDAPDLGGQRQARAGRHHLPGRAARRRPAAADGREAARRLHRLDGRRREPRRATSTSSARRSRSRRA